ncbi:MAG: phosphotransferase [Candidatus Levyibacteriota bacterium]|jgi:hypothetical protein
MKAFEVNINGRILNYRNSRDLDLKDVEDFFAKKYQVVKIRQVKRHVVGILEKDGRKLFLKLAPTEGISAVTQNEYQWNGQFNKLVNRDSKFCVPQNFESGFYKDNLFYLVTDYFDGELYVKTPSKNENPGLVANDISRIIDFAELVQDLPVDEFSLEDNENYLERNFRKVESWFYDIPKEIVEKFAVEKLMGFVGKNYPNLERRTRHGDFTPWHMFKLENGKIGLFDGERAMRNGVEYYDVAYFIQRVFSVLENQNFAKAIFSLLKERNYDLEKLRVVLVSRAIGGFLDESLKEKPNYKIAEEFKTWTLTF